MSLKEVCRTLADTCTESSLPPLRAAQQCPLNSSATTTPNIGQPQVTLATENDQLRAARKRTAPLTYPDECLSRQEFAELVNAWIWDHHRKKVELSADYIGQLERGKIRWPSKLYREAFRAIFGVSADSALGFVNTRSRRAAVKLDDVNRKQFLQYCRL